MRYSSLMLQLYKVKRLGNYKNGYKIGIKDEILKKDILMYVYICSWNINPSRLRQASSKSFLQHKLIPHEGHHQKLIMNIAAEAAELSSSWHGFVLKLDKVFSNSITSGHRCIELPSKLFSPDSNL